MRGVAVDGGMSAGNEPDGDLPTAQPGTNYCGNAPRWSPVSTSWRDDPLGCMVLCATPDMWGSRLLMRGYGTARNARPRELGCWRDSVVVVDEATLHASSSTLVGASRNWRRLPSGVCLLRASKLSKSRPRPSKVMMLGRSGWSLLTSALPRKLTGSWRCGSADPSPFSWRRFPGLRQMPASVTSWLRDRHLAVAALGRCGRTVGCVVNTIALAAEVAADLERLAKIRSMYSLEVIVGRKRPFDVQRLRRDRPGLFTTDRTRPSTSSSRRRLSRWG